MKHQDEKQAGGVTGFHEPRKTSRAFHKPLCRQGLSATALPHSRCPLSESLLTAHLQNPKDRPPQPRILGKVGPGGRPLFPQRGPSHNHILASLPRLWALRISLDANASEADTDQVPRPSRRAPPWRRPPEPACVSGTQHRRHGIPSGHPACPRAVSLKSSLQGTVSSVSEPRTTLHISWL